MTPSDSGSGRDNPGQTRRVLDFHQHKWLSRAGEKASRTRRETELRRSLARDKPGVAHRAKQGVKLSKTAGKTRNAIFFQREATPGNSRFVSDPLIIPNMDPWAESHGSGNQTLVMEDPQPAFQAFRSPTESMMSSSEADAVQVEALMLEDSESIAEKSGARDLFDLPESDTENYPLGDLQSLGSAEEFFGYASEALTDPSFARFFGEKYTQMSPPEAGSADAQDDNVRQDVALEDPHRAPSPITDSDEVSHSTSRATNTGQASPVSAALGRSRSSSGATVRGSTRVLRDRSSSPSIISQRYTFQEKGKWTDRQGVLQQEKFDPASERSPSAFDDGENRIEENNDHQPPRSSFPSTEEDNSNINANDDAMDHAEEHNSLSVGSAEDEGGDVEAESRERSEDEGEDAEAESRERSEDVDIDDVSDEGSFQEEDTEELKKNLSRLRNKKFANRGASKADIAHLYEYIRRTEKERLLQQKRDSRDRRKHGARGRRPQSPSSSHSSVVSASSLAESQPTRRPYPSYRKQKALYRLSQTKHRPPSEVDLQYHVRITAQDFMGRASRKDPLPPNPSASEKAAAQRGVAGPSDTDFRLDLSGKNKRGPWNRRVATVFSKRYVQTQDPKTRDRRKVEAAFLAHIPGLCKQAAKQQPGVILDKLAVVMNRRRQRQKKLGETRWRDSHLLPSLAAHRKWINRLGPDGNSGDESGVDVAMVPGVPVAYGRVPVGWRSKELLRLLRALDVFHLSTRFHDEGKPNPGQWPRYRCDIPGRKPDPHARVVTGLPRNFYDEDWINSRTSDELATLEIRDDVHLDLRIPLELQKIVMRFRHIRNRRDRPLPANLV